MKIPVIKCQILTLNGDSDNNCVFYLFSSVIPSAQFVEKLDLDFDSNFSFGQRRPGIVRKLSPSADFMVRNFNTSDIKVLVECMLNFCCC